MSKLDEFLLSPQFREQMRMIPVTTRNVNVENQEPTEDGSQNDPRPEVGTCIYRSRQSLNSDPDEASYNCILCEIPL